MFEPHQAQDLVQLLSAANRGAQMSLRAAPERTDRERETLLALAEPEREIASATTTTNSRDKFKYSP